MDPQPEKGWATLGTGDRAQLARPLTRLVARILDGVILTVVPLTPVAFDLIDFDDLTEPSVGMSLVLAAVGLIYEVTLVAIRGQTVGKMITNIRIVRTEDGLVPGWDMSAVRWLLPAIPGFIEWFAPSLWAVGLLGLVVYVSLTWDRVRQGWHDKAAKTLVVKV